MDPYNGLLALMLESRSKGGPQLRLGTVAQTNPLMVKIAGVELPASSLRVSSLPAPYVADDQVLMVTEDDQVFYILMKVVKAV